MKLLKFYSKVCSPCKDVDSPISLKVKDMNLELINIDVKNTSNDEKLLMDIYQITSIPTIVLLNEDNDKFEKVVGLKPILDFLNILNKKYFDKYEASEI